MARTVLITGCSGGIGYSTAKSLHKKGWRVFASCRKIEDCKRLRDEGFESFRLDYGNENTIISAVQRIRELNHGKLDALFNNGAYALPGAVEDLSRDALRAIFEVNFFGQIDLINRLLPLLRASNDPRVINCSSVLGFMALPYRGAYNATKFAMEGITDTFRREETGLEVKFILIEPGPIKTNIRKNAIDYFERWIDWKHSRIRKIYEEKIIVRLLNEKKGSNFFELNSHHVSTKVIHALTSRRPRKRYYVTYPTYAADILSRLFPATFQDFLLR